MFQSSSDFVGREKRGRESFLRNLRTTARIERRNQSKLLRSFNHPILGAKWLGALRSGSHIL